MSKKARNSEKRQMATKRIEEPANGYIKPCTATAHMDVIGIYIEVLPKKEKHAVGVRRKFLGCKLRPSACTTMAR